MLYDLTIPLLAEDFQRIDKLSMSRGVCMPVIRKALQRKFPNQLITTPSSNQVLGRVWTIGSENYIIMDNGREVNRCRIELLEGAKYASLYGFYKT